MNYKPGDLVVFTPPFYKKDGKDKRVICLLLGANDEGVWHMHDPFDAKPISYDYIEDGNSRFYEPLKP